MRRGVGGGRDFGDSVRKLSSDSYALEGLDCVIGETDREDDMVDAVSATDSIW